MPPIHNHTMATSHPTQHFQSEDESEPVEQGFEIVDVDVEVDHNHNFCNRGALSESNGNAHRQHCPNTFAFALPTSFRSPSNHGQGNEEEDDEDDYDEEEEAFATTTGAAAAAGGGGGGGGAFIEDDEDEPASPTRTFMHNLPFTKIKTPRKANLMNIFMLSLLCLVGGVGVAVHFVRRYSGARKTEIASNKNLAFIAVGGYDFVQVFNAENKGGECWDINNNRFNDISYSLDNDGNVTECAEKCTSCPGNNQVDGQPLLGFTVEVDSSSCYCLLDAAASGYDKNTCSPDATGSSTALNGSGDIVSTDGDSDYACYKVVQTSSKSNKKPEKQPKAGKTPIRIRN
jgi:hypothetical protein